MRDRQERPLAALCRQAQFWLVIASDTERCALVPGAVREGEAWQAFGTEMQLEPASSTVTQAQDRPALDVAQHPLGGALFAHHQNGVFALHGRQQTGFTSSPLQLQQRRAVRLHREEASGHARGVEQGE